MKNKVVIIVPAFKDSHKDEIYKKIASLYKEKNIKPTILNIHWDNKVMSDYVQEFMVEYKKHVQEDVYTFGFSFGAVISFISSAKVELKQQFLCSLSPYWKEDIGKLKKGWRDFMGKRRIEDFSKISRKDITKNVKTETIQLVGENESEILININKEIYQNLSHKKKFVVVKRGKHEISENNYFEEVKKQISLI